MIGNMRYNSGDTRGTLLRLDHSCLERYLREKHGGLVLGLGFFCMFSWMGKMGGY